MKASDIQLSNTTKSFEYEKISREIETMTDMNQLKEMLRCYVKLYMKHQEVVADLMKM